MGNTWRKDSLNHLKDVLSETLTLRGFELVKDCKQKVHAKDIYSNYHKKMIQ